GRIKKTTPETGHHDFRCPESHIGIKLKEFSPWGKHSYIANPGLDALFNIFPGDILDSSQLGKKRTPLDFRLPYFYNPAVFYDHACFSQQFHYMRHIIHSIIIYSIIITLLIFHSGDDNSITIHFVNKSAKHKKCCAIKYEK